MEKELALKILDVLQKHRRSRGDHSNHSLSLTPFIDLVTPFVKDKSPFKMLLPAFHCKSINPDSVLAATPDGAEEEALKNLKHLCEEIKSIYAYGCELLIVHEGHFYSDIKITPPDDVIEKYEDSIHKMNACPMIHFTNVMQDYSKSYEKARLMLFGKYMDNIEQVKLAVLEDQSMKNKYVAYKTFITHEFASTLMPGLTKMEIKKQSKILAYQWLQRYLVFRKVTGELFSSYFRLSVLAYPSKSKSFSINLIMNTSEFGLPWFHVLVKKPNGSMQLIKKQEAEDRGYKLIFKNNIPWYFEG